MNEPVNSRIQDENQRLQAEVEALRCRCKEAEDALRMEQQLFQTIADNFPDVVFTAKPDGSWDFVNGCIYDITGLPAGSALGHEWTKAIDADDRERVLSQMADALTTTTPFETAFRLRTAQGTFRRFVLRAHSHRDGGGKIMRWIGTATDVEDLLGAEDALHQKQRQQDDSRAKIVHDLRNAAAPIQNAIAILRNPAANTAQKERALEVIDSQLRELRELSERISR